MAQRINRKRGHQHRYEFPVGQAVAFCTMCGKACRPCQEKNCTRHMATFRAEYFAAHPVTQSGK